ncbi:MAG TPA: hypothetical protein VL625_00610, partial [Patescibacteria group bacterium]|nr:hypothetical protein [Patescibacteria group bacterium]
MTIQSHGDNQVLSLNEGHPSLSVAPAEIRDMKIADNGSLIISLKDGHSITITNFHALATADAKIALADGSVIDTHQLEEILAKDMHNVTIHQPAAGEVVTYELLPGQTYEMAFNLGHGAHVTESNGALIITFGDHGEIILKNFDAAMNGLTPPVLTYDGNKFLSAAEFENSLHTDEQANNHEIRHNNANTDLADAAAQKLAGIEPAAGGQGGGAAGGHDFNSSVDPADLNSPPPVGPIGPTALNYGLPIYPTPLGLPAEGVPPGPHITINGGPPDAINAPDAVVKEDSSITIPIIATIGTGAPGNDVLTVTVTGIPGPSVGTFSAPIGTYDAAHGTWTITLPAGHDLSTTFTFTPFPNSDVDFSTMHATASQFDPGTGTTQTAETNFHVTVDAVADVPTIHADNVSGNENTAIAVNISGAVTDLDGSESVT